MLTVAALVEAMGLELLAGQEAARVPIRWVHSTELADPTPWLSGGELLLTTGIRLTSPAEQRAFVERLVRHHLAGLGFGTGFDHDAIPPALLREATALGFPLFEVPYEVPFIAITERAFARLVNEQYDVLERSLAVHRRLERLLLEERGLDEIVRALAATIGGAVLVLDARGEIVAVSHFHRALPEALLAALRDEIAARGGERGPRHFAPEHPDLAGRALALAVGGENGRGARAWLVAVRDSGGLGELERVVLEQAAAIIALELMRRRVMQDAERRLAAELLNGIIDGTVDARDAEVRLRAFGIGARCTMLLFTAASSDSLQPRLQRALGEEGRGALVAAHDGLLCAVVDATSGPALDPLALAGAVRAELAAEQQDVRAAVSRIAPTAALRRSFQEARCALHASALRGVDGAGRVASFRDLGALQILLGMQDEAALRLYCDSVLAPLENGGGEYGEELLRTVDVFLAHNGHWEQAARALYCHRHTLRYRMRRIEELTGRDLASAADRIELWLALRARELLT